MQGHKNNSPKVLMITNAKFFNKKLKCQIQQHIKRIIHQDQVSFISGIQGWLNLHKSINDIHIHTMKDKIMYSSQMQKKM